VMQKRVVTVMPTGRLLRTVVVEYYGRTIKYSHDMQVWQSKQVQ